MRTRKLASLVALLDETHLRVGNRAYTRDNGSYGATTLLKRHLSFGGDGIQMEGLGVVAQGEVDDLGFGGHGGSSMFGSVPAAGISPTRIGRIPA